MMNKEEIRHFKSLLRQGSLRHMNILLDDKFQKELLNIIKDYEDLQQENQILKNNWETLKEKINEGYRVYRNRGYDLVFEIEEVPKEELNDFICYLATQTMEEIIKRIEVDEILGGKE